MIVEFISNIHVYLATAKLPFTYSVEYVWAYKQLREADSEFSLIKSAGETCKLAMLG